MTLENIISKIDSASGRLIVDSMRNPVIKEAHQMLIDASNDLGDMYYVDEMFFTGMDITKELKDTLKQCESTITKGMTDSEKKAYKCGIKNVMSILNSMFEDQNPVVNISGFKNQEELDIKELYEKLNNFDE